MATKDVPIHYTIRPAPRLDARLRALYAAAYAERRQSFNAWIVGLLEEAAARREKQPRRKG